MSNISEIPVIKNPYNSAFIYAIKSSQTDKIYIGSTTLSLNRRLIAHKASYKKYMTGITILYSTAFEIIKYDDVFIEALELVNVDTNIELRMKEKFYFLKFKDVVVNKNNPYQTREEKKKQMDYHNSKIDRTKIKCKICDKEIMLRNLKIHERCNKHIEMSLIKELFIVDSNESNDD